MSEYTLCFARDINYFIIFIQMVIGFQLKNKTLNFPIDIQYDIFSSL